MSNVLAPTVWGAIALWLTGKGDYVPFLGFVLLFAWLKDCWDSGAEGRHHRRMARLNHRITCTIRDMDRRHQVWLEEERTRREVLLKEAEAKRPRPLTKEQRIMLTYESLTTAIGKIEDLPIDDDYKQALRNQLTAEAEGAIEQIKKQA